MNSRTCAYVASRDYPNSWQGTNPVLFKLDSDREDGGLGISEWHCPYPPLGQGDGDEEYCVFHTDPAELPVGIDQQEELLNALDNAGDRPWDDRPEHRGQFIGATFGAIDLSDEMITATDEYDIRFDHARFQAEDDDLDFGGTTFETRGQHPISFVGAEFITGGGDIWFTNATFEVGGSGSVWFNEATFQTDDDGRIIFWKAALRTNGSGSISFRTARFRTDGSGDVWFREATFQVDGSGDIGFREVTFRASGSGYISFYRARFQAGGSGDIWFHRATFRTDANGRVRFEEAVLTDVHFRSVDFGEADLRGADLSGTDLREATTANVSVAGATTCKRLYEGEEWGDRSESRSNSRNWDATARAYHNLKVVFSNHGLIGKARVMHVREHRARSLEAKAAHGWLNRRYLSSLPSRVITGYGVQVRSLVFWMVVLFLFSTAVYVGSGVRDTLMGNISYSVLAFTVAPPGVPEGVGTQVVMMVETFFGTLSIMLLGYILGNRERF
jgi:hypothetical protein